MKTYTPIKLLHGLRILLAGASIIACTLSFVSPLKHGLLAPVLPHLQLLPFLLSGSVIAAVAFFLVTWAFGRVYCTILCPLGIWQDMIHSVGSRITRRRLKRLSTSLQPKTGRKSLPR